MPLYFRFSSSTFQIVDSNVLTQHTAKWTKNRYFIVCVDGEEGGEPWALGAGGILLSTAIAQDWVGHVGGGGEYLLVESVTLLVKNWVRLSHFSATLTFFTLVTFIF